jgi:hypothetical protein
MTNGEGRPPAGAPQTLRIAFWGASQVGKTTTLAAYLGKYRPQWIHRDDEETRKTVRAFQQVWSTLQRNRLASGTTMESNYVLRHRDGCAVQFRDMRGANSRDLVAHGADADALARADAVMIFLEWPGARAADSRAAIDNALQELSPGRPTALLITKCEGHLTAGEFASFADDPLGFARRKSSPPDLSELLESFVAHFREGALFPITVYGWNGGRPAHFYDEFGRLVPWYIRPALVDRPFEHILNRLDLATEGR